MVNLQCLFDEDICKQHLSDFNNDRAKFKTDGAYFALYDVTEHKKIEELDSFINSIYG